MSATKRAGGRTAAPAKSGQTRTKDATNSSWVVVLSPRGVRPGTPVEVNGESSSGMFTDRSRPLPPGSYGFHVSSGGAAWAGEADVPSGRRQGDPLQVTLSRVGAVVGARAVLRPRKEADAGPAIVDMGRPADVRTIVYVHGIGNKPPASVLRCQWDTALFGHPMGDRSRMAYWVDRDRYPAPGQGTCGDSDLTATDDDEASTAAILSLGTGATRLDGAAREEEATRRTIDALTPDDARRATLSRIARTMAEAADRRAAVETNQPGRTGARILPGGKDTRRMLARLFTRAFLPNVYDFLFDDEKRRRMTDALWERLRGGGEPFVIVAHSQGTMIAYELLRTLKREDCHVPLLVTIGSPLALQEVKDHLARDGGTLQVPACVDKWVNVADPFDPVAADPTLANDYAASEWGVKVEDVLVSNLDRPFHPHSATGYLGSEAVRTVVRKTAGLGFVQRIAGMVVATNVASATEDAGYDAPQEVLIQLADSDDPGEPRLLKEVADKLIHELEELAKQRPRNVPWQKPDRMRRFVCAQLTAAEIDALRTLCDQLQVKQVWANSEKRALIATSAATVQAVPARLGYGATGRGINWAVLDTGIDERHPHFKAHDNVRSQWDCTGRGDPKPLAAAGEGAAGSDPNGHGTHVAGIIAGEIAKVVVDRRSGREVPLAGMAPEARLIGFRVLGADGAGNDTAIIKALDKVAQLNEEASGLVIHGVNLSLGSSFDPLIYGVGHTPLCQELRRLWRQGVLVCLAAGNEGYAQLQGLDGVVNANMDLSIGDPANLEEAIAVGSVHKANPHTYGISYFSSRGPTADGRRKPDLVAPGEKILSALANPRATRNGVANADELYVEMSGTSMAAPHVSGLLAAFLSVRREFIGEPDRVKRVLLAACTDLGRDQNMQGNGLANLVKMLLAT